MKTIIYKGAKFNEATFTKDKAEKFLEIDKQGKITAKKRKQFGKDLVENERQKDKKKDNS